MNACMNKLLRQYFVDYVDENLMGTDRVEIIARWNGKDSKILCLPFTLTMESFIRQAKEKHWIDQLLTTDKMRQGMIRYLLTNYPSLKGNELVISIGITAPTGFSHAISHYAELGRNQLAKVRTALHTFFNFHMEISKPETKK